MFRRALLLAAAALTLLSGHAAAQDPLTLYPHNYKVLLENDRVRVLDFKLRKGAKEQMHMHPMHVVVVLTGFKIRFTFADGSTGIRETKDGDILFSEPASHASENIGATDAHGVLVELKTPKGHGGDMADLLTAVTYIKGVEGKQDELKNDLLNLTAPTRAEPGNVAYDLYQSTVNPNNFLRYEVWRNDAALEAHKQTPHIKASFAKRQQQGWTTDITTWKRVVDPRN